MAGRGSFVVTRIESPSAPGEGIACRFRRGALDLLRQTGGRNENDSECRKVVHSIGYEVNFRRSSNSVRSRASSRGGFNSEIGNHYKEALLLVLVGGPSRRGRNPRVQLLLLEFLHSVVLPGNLYKSPQGGVRDSDQSVKTVMSAFHQLHKLEW